MTRFLSTHKMIYARQLPSVRCHRVLPPLSRGISNCKPVCGVKARTAMGNSEGCDYEGTGWCLSSTQNPLDERQMAQKNVSAGQRGHQSRIGTMELLVWKRRSPY